MQATPFTPEALKPGRTFEYERQFVCCRFSADGRWLFAAGHDGQLHRWDLNAAEPVREAFAGHRGWVEGLQLTPDGQRLLSADSSGQVFCWPVAEGELKPLWNIPSACGSWLRGLAISGDGQWLATCGNEPVVRVFATADGKLVHEFRGHAQPVFSVLFTPDSSGLVSGDLFGRVLHWSLSEAKCVRELDAGKLYKPFHHYQQGGVRAMTFDAAGRTLYCAGFEGVNANQAQGIPTVLAFDWELGRDPLVMTTAAAFNGPVMDVLFHPDGYLVAAGSSEQGGTLWFWKPGAAQNFHLLKHPTSFRKLALHPDRTRLAAAVFGSTSGQRGGNGRQLNAQGEYADFGGLIGLFEGQPAS